MARRGSPRLAFHRRFCQNPDMRLTPTEQQIIRTASLRCFGVPPRLFGSRTDDARRGGDIDLYIEADLSPQEAFERETPVNWSAGSGKYCNA